MVTKPVPLIKLGAAQYVVLAATLLVTIPVIVWFMVGDQIYSLYLEDIVGPRVRREFGFEVGWVQVEPTESETGRWHAVTKVVPGGILERAGVRRGDTGCLGVDTGGIHDVYAALNALQRQAEVTISLSNVAVGRQPCRTVTIRR
jgi:S1-C subfamily serine protease